MLSVWAQIHICMDWSNSADLTDDKNKLITLPSRSYTKSGVCRSNLDPSPSCPSPLYPHASTCPLQKTTCKCQGENLSAERALQARVSKSKIPFQQSEGMFDSSNDLSDSIRLSRDEHRTSPSYNTTITQLTMRVRAPRV